MEKQRKEEEKVAREKEKEERKRERESRKKEKMDFNDYRKVIVNTIIQICPGLNVGLLSISGRYERMGD